MHVGATLKKVMKERGVAPATMAEHCGVTRGAVSNWFSSGRITKENLVKAASLLGVTVEDLVVGELGDRAAPRLDPLPQAPLADDTLTLLSLFNQLDPFKRSKVIAFAADQIGGKFDVRPAAIPHKFAKPAGKKLVAIKDEGALSKRPKSSESSVERGQRGRK